MNKSIIKYIIFTLLIGSCTSYNTYAANIDRNYNYQISASCYGNNSTDKCYPFWYENSDGSSNELANFVAMLNYVSPVLNLLFYKGGMFCLKKIDKSIIEDINNNLKSLDLSEEQIKNLLTKIITDFDNGIGKFSGDKSCILGAIENLNRDKCQNCINSFVDIVSHLASNKDKKHRKLFLSFTDQLTDNCINQDHQKIPVINIDDEKSVSDKAKSACFDKWTHPFHWSSVSYATLLAIIPGVISKTIDINNRAGSYIGDMANISNIIVIPTCYIFTCLQYWKNSDRIKTQKSSKKIDYHLTKIDGIIEIAAQVIGKMDNAFDKDTSKNIIITLILSAWPQDHVDEFITLASNNHTTNEQVKSFVDKIRTSYLEKHFGRKNIDDLLPNNQENEVIVDNND